ncbi:MAG TPA: hypothetical protein DEO56_00930 [Nitrosomonas nitrosa]|uniref:Uncharacterized protein n=1 Tax=Nitrosomonas nitrosa TaxID=52442 RepID=A0A1I4NXC1_9PROT|nr:hypothetical protein [Nitrosomonas nitrosa]MCO6435054.1 hypothetical protein [Nitrosomonas nitrosa]PTR00703.1 hypothetical protein C8R30_10773 [Nitrosomonas nitrosa]CAE6516231.1 conserved hypothetical protein [Nitrosomonas nitrosa]SFM20045.1 hypothetical protein SAMN05421880_10951 [Nitrosomonas nitrosa]HBZ29156.1 hypothetical protein [Nitrosomonas nitrosa]
MSNHLSPPALVTQMGGSYAAKLGINLDSLNTHEVYKWFVASLLYGAPISGSVATRTWHVFAKNDILTPKRMIERGWDKLVSLLDQGGYVRYDYKTATKLLDVNHALLKDYAGNLNELHAAATDDRDLEQRIMDLGKGVGKVTVNIFLRELRGRWIKANPPLSPLALKAAQILGYFPDNWNGDPDDVLAYLQGLWKKCGMTAERFCDFEAAMIRKGLEIRRSEGRHRRLVGIGQ